MSNRVRLQPPGVGAGSRGRSFGSSGRASPAGKGFGGAEPRLAGRTPATRRPSPRSLGGETLTHGGAEQLCPGRPPRRRRFMVRNRNGQADAESALAAEREGYWRGFYQPPNGPAPTSPST